MNKNNARTWATAQIAAALLDRCKIHGVLVGTAGLAALGVWDPPPGTDLDFFVDAIPEAEGVELMDSIPGTYKHQVGEWHVDGVKVQFILNDRDEAQRFLTRQPKVVGGVKVGTLHDILGLKKWGNRPKDREFFSWNPDFAKLVEDVEPCDVQGNSRILDFDELG